VKVRGIEGLSLNVSGADEKQIAGANTARPPGQSRFHLVRAYQARYFNSGWPAELAGGIKEVLAVGKERWGAMRKFVLVETSGWRYWPPEAAICEIGPKFCLQKRMIRRHSNRQHRYKHLR